MTIDLGPIGIWSSARPWGDDAAEAAAELDELGFGALWFGGLTGDLTLVDTVLAASRRIVVASGVVNVWTSEPGPVAAFAHEMEEAHPGRFLLGVGASHKPAAEAVGRRYERPLGLLEAYLDGLDAAPHPVPAERRVLAALGPRALELAARRSAGAHPYLVPPEHTQQARRILGPGKLLAVEQKVVLETDAGTAREIARAHLRRYLASDNYRRNLLRVGFEPADFEHDGSDRLIDALYAWGGPEVGAKRVAEHQAAGADHVCVQVVSAGPGLPRAGWRTMAEALL
jgi:probable F420-dependent oxidoreductase